jgi:hypothetical protein
MLSAHKAATAELERQLAACRVDRDDALERNFRLERRCVLAEVERDKLRAKCEKVMAWLLRLADNADIRAERSDRFPSLQESNRRDARNYRAMAKNIKAVLAPTPETKSEDAVRKAGA